MEALKPFNVGDKVHITSYRHALKPKPGLGTVVYIFEAGVVPEVKLLMRYYGVSMNHKLFSSFNRILKVDRYIVQRNADLTGPNDPSGNYLVLPTPSLFLIRKVDEKKDNTDEEKENTDVY